MSPSECGRGAAPMYASTPYSPPYVNVRPLTNGYDAVDNKLPHSDSINGNTHGNIAIESTNSMDVLSCGESDAGDTLSRRNNNSMSSCALGTLREGGEAPRRRSSDITYFVAKELLMTERTYKRDLELLTVTLSTRVGELSAGGGGGGGDGGGEAAAALARACLALEPLALPGGALLARLERALASPDPSRADDAEEPEYKRIAELLYDYLSNTAAAYETYIERAAALVGLVESVRRCSCVAAALCAAFDARAVLPLACLLLRPLHRLLHYAALAHELRHACGGRTSVDAAHELAQAQAARARAQLQHVENHAALCQLQRDIAGYDKLLVAEREFIRLGCVYKHSTRGLQQRMLFLFSDVCVVANKSGVQFRALAALPLHALRLRRAELPHSFTLTGEDVNLLLSASNEQEFCGWFEAFEVAIENARDKYTEVDIELTPYEQEIETSPCGGGGGVGGGGGALAHVCWHRAMSLAREHLHLAMRTQLSGYLLRKFKKSPGWQKLWVVFAAFTLYFYKSWQDDAPLAALPLLGYSVGAPAPEDGIDKEFVFKLQFKNHVYFFRADSHFTNSRWTEVLRTATIYNNHN